MEKRRLKVVLVKDERSSESFAYVYLDDLQVGALRFRTVFRKVASLLKLMSEGYDFEVKEIKEVEDDKNV